MGVDHLFVIDSLYLIDVVDMVDVGVCVVFVWFVWSEGVWVFVILVCIIGDVQLVQDCV